MLRGSSLTERHSVAGSPGGGGSSFGSFSGCCGRLSSGWDPIDAPRPVSHFRSPSTDSVNQSHVTVSHTWLCLIVILTMPGPEKGQPGLLPAKPCP